jgi:hypothetical protein
VLARVALFVLVLCFSTGQAQMKAYKTKNLEEVTTWYQMHSKTVTMMGSEPVFSGFTDLLVSALLQKRSSVRIIIGDAGVERFRRVALAGGEVRLHSGAFTGRNGYGATLLILENRYALTRRGDEWILIDSAEAAGQVNRYFNLLWDFCTPLKLR